MRLLACLTALCLALTWAAPAPAQSYHYVDGLDPQGDNWLALRTQPHGRGSRMTKMGPGTLLQVLDQDGKWMQVRTETGQTGWAHSNWIYCCRSASAAPTRQTGASCEDLWYQRNAIWHRYGYCFQGTKGKQTFGNEGCVRSQEQARAMMDQADSDAIDRIVGQERAQGCR